MVEMLTIVRAEALLFLSLCSFFDLVASILYFLKI